MLKFIPSPYKFKEVRYYKMENGNEIVNNIIEEWKEITLAAFILRLNRVYHASPSLMGKILTGFSVNEAIYLYCNNIGCCAFIEYGG